jgi:prevent-host-death family protein
MARPPLSDRRIITATDIRRNFSAILRRLRKRREHTIIESSGTPVAVLLSMAEYEQLMRYKRLMVFEKFTRELGQTVEKSGLSEADLMNELEETKREVYLERYGSRG